MTNKSSNNNLRKANRGKNDEFYTQLPDIEKELNHYKKQLKGKIIFCNCDDPKESNFFMYFAQNFSHLGIKKLITTHYSYEGKKTYKLEIEKDINKDGKINWKDAIKTPLKENGDFRTEEVIDILKGVDVVVTNPPFSLFRDYIEQLMKYKKKFLILGNMNALTYKEIFKLIKENKIWSGYGFNMSLIYKSPYKNTLESNRKFVTGKGYEPDNHIKVPAINWFTNLSTKKQKEEIILYEKYYGNEEKYPKYDNYDAINVDKVKEIPVDYYGKMGVPITFIGKFNTKQFEIVDGLNRYSILDGPTEKTRGKYLSQINGKPIYIRVIIKRIKK